MEWKESKATTKQVDCTDTQSKPKYDELHKRNDCVDRSHHLQVEVFMSSAINQYKLKLQKTWSVADIINTKLIAFEAAASKIADRRIFQK